MFYSTHTLKMLSDSLKGLLAFCVFYSTVVFSSCDVVRLVDTKRADNIIANRLFKAKLEKAGYTVELVSASLSDEAYQLLRHKKADIYLSTWMPLDAEYVKAYLLDGSIRTIHRVLAYTQVGIATNIYAEQAGIYNLKQVTESEAHAKLFDYKIYIGQEDWQFADQLQGMLERNLHGLAAFQVIRLNTHDLREKLAKAQEQKQPILFFARRLSYVGHNYAQNFLYDTHGVFDKYHAHASIYSSVRYDLPKNCPQVIQSLRDFNYKEDDALHLLKRTASDAKTLHAALDNPVDFPEHYVPTGVQHAIVNDKFPASP